MPYERKNFLTSSETVFYKWIAPIAEKYNQGILAKTTVGDIVSLADTSPDAKFYYDLAKDQKVDFALYDKSNMEITCIIQLESTKSDEREAVERLCICAGYGIIYHQSREHTKEALEDRFLNFRFFF